MTRCKMDAGLPADFVGNDVAPSGTGNQGRRAVDEREDWDGATQTTSSGLIRLASVVAGLVREGAVDTRFGAKLFKRLDKEARRVAERGPVALSETD